MMGPQVAFGCMTWSRCCRLRRRLEKTFWPIYILLSSLMPGILERHSGQGRQGRWSEDSKLHDSFMTQVISQLGIKVLLSLSDGFCPCNLNVLGTCRIHSSTCWLRITREFKLVKPRNCFVLPVRGPYTKP